MSIVSDEFTRDFNRGVLRAAFVNVFWAVITARKKEEGFTLKQLADRLGIGKWSVSRWFSGEPNWGLNTIADIASALDVAVNIEVVDRKTGKRFSPTGEIVVTTVAETRQPTIISVVIANDEMRPIETTSGGSTELTYELRRA